jgi:hypothetical protein
MSGPQDVYKLIYACKQAVESSGRIYLNLAGTRSIYPNGAVPMAVALQHYRREGLIITSGEIAPEVSKTDFLLPRQATHINLNSLNIKNVIWRYTGEREADELSKAFVSQLEESIECGPGVLEALNWCLFEVMDNVFQHSHAESGFAMMQLHYNSKRCVVAVADDGIGIQESFRESNVYRSRDEYEAIMFAIQEKVTSKTKNMGNGLYGLMRVVGLNGGEMGISSGRGQLAYKGARLSGDYKNSRPVLDAMTHRGTVVDWQLDVSRPISLATALGVPRPNFRLEDIEDTEGEYRVLVSEFEEGLGTRRSAEQVRVKLVNYLNDGAPRLVLDFINVNVISSSFADEVLGKLALQMGLVQFINKFRLDNMSDTIEAIVNRAIQQRIAEGDSSNPGSARS